MKTPSPLAQAAHAVQFRWPSSQNQISHVLSDQICPVAHESRGRNDAEIKHEVRQKNEISKEKKRKMINDCLSSRCNSCVVSLGGQVEKKF